MDDRPIGYRKSKRGFSWLVYVRINGKEVALVLFKVIMEDSNDSFGSGFKGQGLYLVFLYLGESFLSY